MFVNRNVFGRHEGSGAISGIILGYSGSTMVLQGFSE